MSAAFSPSGPASWRSGAVNAHAKRPWGRRGRDCALVLASALLATCASFYLFPRQQLVIRHVETVGVRRGTGQAAPCKGAAAVPLDRLAVAGKQQQQQRPPQLHPQRQQQQQQQQQQCQLDIPASPLVNHCQWVRQVCVDQGQLIFHERRHQPGGGQEPDPLPEISVHPTRLYFFPWTAGTKSESSDGGSDSDGNSSGAPADGGGLGESWEDSGDAAMTPGDGGAPEGAGALQRHLLRGQPRRAAYETHEPGEHFARRRLLPMPTRPASALEPTPYLAAPTFSTCTVPLVVYPIFAENFAHLFHDVASFLHSLLRRTPWRAHARLVAFTPDGLALTQPEAQLLPVLSNMSVTSWADFSRRLPPGYDPQADPQQPPASREGGEQRCFASMLICGGRFKPDRPLEFGVPQSAEEERARLRKAVPRENFGFGQEVVQWYRSRGLVPAPPQPAAAAAAPGSGGSGSRRLKVLFMRRDSGGRQLLNAEELVRSCNAWRYTLPGGGGTVTADCRQVELPNLEAGIAAAQEADVFVGMHGANMANSYLMRPGSSTVEITPYEFGKMKGVFGPCTQNAQDASSQLLWWSAVVCDASLSTPGPDEAAGREPSRWWPRDRSARVPWAALEAILEEIVRVRAGLVLRRGPSVRRSTSCLRCPWPGLAFDPFVST